MPDISISEPKNLQDRKAWLTKNEEKEFERVDTGVEKARWMGGPVDGTSLEFKSLG